MKIQTSTYQKQSGAALVVGLILLVVLTLMALSSMNTATLDLVMAGNEQYRGRAFTASESGIEQSLVNYGAFDSTKDYSGTSTTTGNGNDSFIYNITRPNSGVVMPPPSGSSAGEYGAIYFTVSSTGKSDRSSGAVNTQDLLEIVKASSSDFSYSKSVCATSSDLSSTCP